jgi:uncharacterized protein (TIGR02147 family)
VKTSVIRDTEKSAAAFDIAAFLRERFRAATGRNSRFSLRSFAKQLGIDHSTLSQVLRNRRRLSARDLKVVGRRIGMDEAAISVYLQNYRRKRSVATNAKDSRHFHLDLDTFQLLSVWYHYAILELLQVQGFKTDSRWIAATLGIAVEDVNISLQRLLRLGLLEMSARDRWIDKSGDADFYSTGITESAGNLMQQQIHDLAVGAIRNVPERHRIHRQMMIAVDSKQLPQFLLLADEFMNDVRSLVLNGGAKDDVYQAEISFFPVTTFKKIRGDKNG